ncbi:UDP-galactose transporter [Exidia glandulosa HHB12029]|uniref:GDP-mannose transporter n=1 Tax=Exidia glandulosa HHB12029 TaxID=1314781 RepID=A0A165DZ21_EXIGL|nr:UDP-galactose transporter [Exidia glandulosa HHB12029]
MSNTPNRSPRPAVHDLDADERGDYDYRKLQQNPVDELSRTAEEALQDIKKTLQNPALAVDSLGQSSMFPIAAYCLASIFMTVLNKFVVSGTGFSMNFLLLCIQSSVCTLCVVVCKSAGLMTYRNFDIEDAKRWFPISTLLVAVIYTGSKSLQFLSIPVYTIFKNLTIILIAYGEMFMTGATVTGLTLVSFLLMVISSIIAAATDSKAATSSPWGEAAPAFNVGYFWMFLNCIVTAAYALLMRGRLKAMNFKDADTMFYNNLLSIPVLGIASLVFEDWSSTNLHRNFPEETRSFLIFAIIVSGAAAVFISYTTAWCVRATSSTTYSMVGALNKLPVAASGIIFFGDPASMGNVSAIGMGFVAGIVYAVAKSKQSKPGADNSSVREKTELPLHQRRAV